MLVDIAISDTYDYFDHLTKALDGPVQTMNGEQRLLLPADLGQGTITRMRISSGIEVIVSDVVLIQDLNFRIRETCRIFELNYCVSGEIFGVWNNKELYTGPRSGNICYLENIEIQLEKKAGTRHCALEVRLCSEELFRYAQDAEEQRLIEALLLRHKGKIDRYPDSPAISKCVSDLIHHGNSKGAMKRLYMESKVMELIALWGVEEAQLPSSRNLVLRSDDIDKLKQARELILSHLDQPLSIHQMARLVGINEFKLKKGFLELFGVTVFEMVRKDRMEKALQLMDMGRMNVGETAAALGYSNMSNFASAFRKQYGCNPGEYLKQIYEREQNRRKQSPSNR